MAEILIIAARPQLDASRVTQRLMQAGAATDPARLELRDLCVRYPDDCIDAAAEPAALAQACWLVWLHPVHRYPMPPPMKLWLDEVFAFGWAGWPATDRR